MDDQQVAIVTLPPQEQPAALFERACRALADAGKVNIKKSQTNSAIVRGAALSANAEELLWRLAIAADRTIFGGWQPPDAELSSLHRDCEALVEEQQLTT